MERVEIDDFLVTLPLVTLLGKPLDLFSACGGMHKARRQVINKKK